MYTWHARYRLRIDGVVRRVGHDDGHDGGHERIHDLHDRLRLFGLHRHRQAVWLNGTRMRWDGIVRGLDGHQHR